MKNKKKKNEHDENTDTINNSELSDNEVDSSADSSPEDEQIVVETNIDYKQQCMRAQADYANLQKSVAQQRGEWARMSEMHIVDKFIPVYDNFKKAFAHDMGDTKKEWDAWRQGIEYIKKQLKDILSEHTVSEIQTVGQQFDPSLHDAVGEEESEEWQQGTIIREIDGGYTHAGKVVRPAKVIIAK
jgi:molecular chaperone GrpE